MDITRTIANKIAGRMQISSAQFECTITELSVMSINTARISISGTEDNLKKLFEYVDEPFEQQFK